MAEGAVTFLLSKITSYLEEEAQLLTGIRREALYIKDELEQMKAFLGVADATEESNGEFKAWVKQVRELAHDIEDVLDEFVLHSSSHHGEGTIVFLRKSIRSIKNLLARHEIASEMRDIKSRVNEIARRRWRYQYQQPLSSNSSNRWYDPGEDALRRETELEGIEEPKAQLSQWLLSGESRRKVISGFGMAGLGKTTLVKEVYHDVEIQRHFQNHAWITVSQSFDINELMKKMIQQLFAEIRQPIPQDESRELKAVVNEFLQKSRYVVVLDAVWTINAWKEIEVALPNNECGSRVMLTTRKTEVASTSSKESQGHMYSLKPLSEEKTWSLFSRMTFGNNCPPYLEGISRSILRRCEGLPLAIVDISGVLSRRNIDEWDMINRGLGAQLEGDNELQSFRKILWLSIDELTCDVKTCFLYLSIFPEDHLIERMRLIRLWVSERFVKETEGITLEEVADDYLRELLDRNLIQVAGKTSDGRPKLFRVHDLHREIIVSTSRDQNIATIAKGNTNWPEKVRRLSVHNTLTTIQRHKNVRQLRSLLMFGVQDPLSQVSIKTLFFDTCRLLTVLDLRGVPLELFPDAVVQFLHLRYLSLRDTKIKTIPGSIKKLRNLETLDLKHTLVTRLPVEILKLRRLRHLLLYRSEIKSYVLFHSKQGFEAPMEIGKLQTLQKLCFLEANNADIVSQLGELNQLRRLGIMKLKKDDGSAFCSAIEKLGSLRALSITSLKEDEIIDIQNLSSPPVYLSRLYLTGRLESFPQWITSLHMLAKVFLRWSRLDDDPLESLRKLPNLVHLEFLQAYNGVELHFKSENFQKLRILSLDKLDALESIIVDKGAMPNLERLLIQRCSMLKKLPTGIEFLTNIEILEFLDMPKELTSKIDSQGPDCGKVQHIPKVYSTYWRFDKWHPFSLEKLDNGGNPNLPSTSTTSQISRGWLNLPHLNQLRNFEFK